MSQNGPVRLLFLTGKTTDLLRGGLFIIIVASTATGISANGQRDLVPEDLAEGKVIVVDPGHGGHDSGGQWPSGMAEKDLTLSLAIHLRTALHGICSTHLTRDGDYWVDLERRTAMANHRGADALISLHASSGFDPQARGARIFYHADDGGNPFSLKDQENLGETRDELPPWDLVQSKYARQSRLLADTLRKRLVAAGFSTSHEALKAALYVLKGADAPAVMIEVGHAAASGEPEQPLGEDTLKSLAQAIAHGLNDYFGKSGSCIGDVDVIEENLGAGRGAAW